MEKRVRDPEPATPHTGRAPTARRSPKLPAT